MNNSRAPSEPDAAPGFDDSRSEKSPGGRSRPIPPAHEYIQVNGCKTPGCENFGVAPREGAILKGLRARREGDHYAVIGLGSTDLSCKLCGKFSRLKSNKGVFEEMRRQGSYLWVESPLRCPDEACANHRPDRSSTKRLFYRRGKTRSGSDRWQCCLCKKTFSLGKSTRYHKKPHLNQQVFALLVNKVPINRIMAITELGAASVYGKIDFIYRQCRLFAASREMKLPGLSFERLYLSTDRQDYMVNWGDRRARKTIQLTAVTTVDRVSGYVFGMTPNFDASLTPDELEEAVAKAGETSKAYAMREYARLWTASDYRASVERSKVGKGTARLDLDAPEVLDAGQQLPRTGVQVHADYLMHGHYWLLRYLLAGASKLRFFLDQDAGLLGACMGAFADRIGDRTADIVVVGIKKDLKTTERQREHAKAKGWFEAQKELHPMLKDHELRTKLMADRVRAARAASPVPEHALQSAWIEHPFPDLAEPNKRFRYATDYGDYDDEHTANLLNLGTLWPVDTVFNRVRRFVAYCERPVRSARRASGLWQIYAPYDPAMIEKLLFIYRVWHNYVWVSPKSGKTAAERIGLAAGKIRTQDILYFDVRGIL